MVGFTDLDEYKDGVLIVYTLEEVQVAGYTVAITGDASGYTVTNSHTPGKTSVPVTKVWDDANDQDGKRPDSVTVRLLADGVDTGETKELNAANGWTATFTDLDEYEDGELIVYTLEEVQVAGYTVAITGDASSGYIVTNSYTPPPTPTYDPISVPLSARKTLVNGTLKEGQFSFQLLGGNKKVIETKSNDASGQVRFTDRRFSKTGTFIYTIREVKGGNAKITYDNTVYRIIIKITASSGKLSATVDYEKDGVPYAGDIKFVNRMQMPKTGDSYLRLPLYLIILSLVMLGGVVLLRRKREYRK